MRRVTNREGGLPKQAQSTTYKPSWEALGTRQSVPRGACPEPSESSLTRRMHWSSSDPPDSGRRIGRAPSSSPSMAMLGAEERPCYNCDCINEIAEQPEVGELVFIHPPWMKAESAP